MFRSFALLATLVSSLGWADAFGLGDGHWAARTVTSGTSTLNSYHRLLADGAVGDSALKVDIGAGMRVGDLVWVVQVRSDTTSDVGNRAPVDLQSTPAGSWHWARIIAVTDDSIQFTPPLASAFTMVGTQVVVVPEFTSVTIASGAVVTAPAWNGVTGGVVAFLATQGVQVDGVVSVEGLGLRGGAGTRQDEMNGCGALTEPENRGARRGEGLARASDGSDAGRGNVSLGGGGGVCDSSGGGGGGHQGEGGQGGVSYDAYRPVGGLGGTRVPVSPQRLFFGGGGGAGSNEFGPGSPGGAGGGLVWVRASAIRGSGRWLASGLNGASAPTGSGGGGGGGSVVLEATSIDCRLVDVSGGVGGSVNSNQAAPHGTGGGGGGGLIRLFVGQLAPACELRASSGLAGIKMGAEDGGVERFGGATPVALTNIFQGRIEQAPFDAGSAPDGGPVDAGTGSADGSIDAGTGQADAGGIDAGPADAGTAPTVLAVGCSCQKLNGVMGLLAMMLGGLVLRRKTSAR